MAPKLIDSVSEMRSPTLSPRGLLVCLGLETQVKVLDPLTDPAYADEDIVEH